MAFAWLGEDNFEEGALASIGFDTETDAASLLSIAHYSDLARYPYPLAPWRGAYCLFADLSKNAGTSTAYLEETGTWDMALDETQHWRFMFYASTNLTMADNDEFAIWKIRSASADEGVVTVQYTTANGFRIGVGETAGAQWLPLRLGEWHAVQISATLDDGASDDGTLDLTVDGASATQVASLDQLAVTHGRLGAMDLDAGTTAGYLLFDQVVTDDAAIAPPDRRFKETVVLTKDGHAFVGPGYIKNISLLSGAGTDCVLTAYDTDVANTSDSFDVVIELKNTANNELVDPAGVPARVERGCYVTMSGTTPRAIVQFCKTPAYGSDAAIRQYGLRRKAMPRNV